MLLDMWNVISTHHDLINFPKVGLAVVVIQSLLSHGKRRLNQNRVLRIEGTGGQDFVDAIHGGNDSCDVRCTVVREKEGGVLEYLQAR